MGSLKTRLDRLESARGPLPAVEEPWFDRVNRFRVLRGLEEFDPPENEPPPIFGETYLERVRRLRRQRAELEDAPLDGASGDALTAEEN